MKILELHDALRKAGFDISGVSGSGPADAKITGWNITPTREQEAAADELLKAFDWTEITDSEIKDRLSRLTTEEKQRVLDAALEQLALANPKLLDRAIVTATARVR